MFSAKNINKLFFWLLVIQALVNLVGALGPELGFDALWYHLTEAKLFLSHGSIDPIPGNLLYWSGLPRLAEILFMIGPAKLIHWAFGILSAYFVYRLGGMGAALLWYSTLLVGWLSTTAYIDLIATAFLLGALLYRNFRRIVFLVLAGATKLNSLVYGLVITIMPWAALGYLPFMFINWKATGNPVYPFGENFGFESEWFFNGFFYWLSRPLRLFFDPVYRVGPVMLIIWLLRPKWSVPLICAFFLWFLMPGTDFGRFALFPLALLAIAIPKTLGKLAVSLIILQAVVGIGGRMWANAKYLPVLTGKQAKEEFLSQNLKFHFGDWYDVDDWFATNIKPTDKVLVYGVHNLYYLNFPYDHLTWMNPDEHYTHILMGDNQSLPDSYGTLPLIYQNSLTRTTLYENTPIN